MRIENNKLNLRIFLLFLVLSIIMTYPLIFRMWNCVPAHSVDFLAKCDPYLNLYILKWDVHQLFLNPLKLFQANTFYPYSNTLAYSEHMIVNALFAMPVALVTGNMVFSYNLIFLLTFALSGFGAYLLVYYLTEDKDAGIAAGIIFAFCPYKFARQDAIQLMCAQFMPFVLLFMHRFHAGREYRNLFLFLVFFLLQVLSCWYYAFYITIAVIVYSVFFVFKKENMNFAFWKRTGLFLVLALFIILPFALPYYYVSQDNPGFFRSFNLIVGWSADLRDYITPPASNRIYGNLLKNLRPACLSWEHEMFMGISVFLLAVYAALRIKIRENYKIFIYLLLAIFAFVMSLGPYLHVWGKNTGVPLFYTIFYDFLPGFKSMRGVSRIAVIFMLAVSVLAGFGVSKLKLSKSPNPNPRQLRARVFLGFIIPLIILAEYFSVPIKTTRIPMEKEIPPVYNWLNKQKGDCPLVEFDLSVAGGYVLSRESEYMYFSTFHWKKIVNGWSGYLPAGYGKILELSKNDFPSKELVHLLRGLELEYVLVHTAGVDELIRSRIMEKVASREDIKTAGIFGDDIVFALKPLSKKDKIQDLVIEPFIPDKIADLKKVNICFHIKNKKAAGYAGALYFIDFKVKLSMDGAVVKAYHKKMRMPYYIEPGLSETLLSSIPVPEVPGVYSLNMECRVSGIEELFGYNKKLEVFDSGVFKSDDPGSLCAAYSGIVVQPEVRVNGYFRVDMVVSNAGDTIWLSDKPERKLTGRVAIGAVWYDDRGSEIKLAAGENFENRYPLPCDVSPGQAVPVTAYLLAPEVKSGEYTVKISLVCENVAWFYDKGSPSIKRSIKVIHED